MLRSLRVANLVLIREAELELSPGLNVVTGETGAGKTILTQAVGLLLGQRGDAALVGPAAGEAYVEAELDLPDSLFDGDEPASLRELRPEDEPGLVVARRVFADGRSRAYAWGRAAPREDVAAAVERLVAMSGQFEQRRLARPSHQLDLLDAFAGETQLERRRQSGAAWRALQAARRAREEAAGRAHDLDGRRAELEALAASAASFAAVEEDELRAERERLRHATALAEAAALAAEALSPEAGERGAADLAADAVRALARVAGLSRELDEAAAEAADSAERLRLAGSALRGFLASLEARPGRLEELEETFGRIADAKRRFGVDSLAALRARAVSEAPELEAIVTGGDPLAAADAAVATALATYRSLAEALGSARRDAARPFAAAVREELAALGLGAGELAVELRERQDGPAGADEAVFLVRANEGLPFSPVATTASGGELSRIALALRAVAHASAGEPTIVFDEIDAGIGGTTAHAVADALRRLAATSQVIAITHLPQIASAADRHFRVEKVAGDPTHTRIELLADEERRDELERMLGGREFLGAVAGEGR